MRRNTPATTIVLEWSRAETGVGPSMAEGSHGWSPNWADFPVAARTSPIRGKLVLLRLSEKICCRSHVLELKRNHAMAARKPMSPIRLYRMACRAAVFASARPYHQPISKKDIIPTPSHPIKSWKRLLAVTKISMVMRNISRYLKNRLI